MQQQVSYLGMENISKYDYIFQNSSSNRIRMYETSQSCDHVHLGHLKKTFEKKLSKLFNLFVFARVTGYKVCP